MGLFTLIVTDLYLSREQREALAGSIERRATLPAFELLLARAGERRTTDWRALACAVAQVPHADPVPVAALARISDDRAASARAAADQWFLASAVHFAAALDHVQLSAVLRLTAEEWQQIVSGFNAEFGADVGTLETIAGELFWRPIRAVDARTVDPARVVGGDVHDALPDGADGGRLRQLMTEVQMWLHDHPLNRAREQAGLPPANGLWFWGGGVLPRWRPSVELPQLFSTDGFMCGLWTLLGGPREPLPRALPSPESWSARGAIVALALRELSGASWLERLRALESEWLAPAVKALRTGAVDRLQLQINDTLFVVRRADLRRFWRRPRPWLEAVA